MQTPSVHLPARRARNLFRGLVLGSGGTVLALAAALALEACGADESTGGRRVVLHTRVVVDDTEAAGFTTGRGWHVALDGVLVASGPLYYFDGVPPLVRLETPDAGLRFTQLLGLGTAFAHPGHYSAGTALGQMLKPSSEDLLAGPAALPDGDGVSGTYRSARWSFATPTAGPVLTDLEGHVAVVTGTATKDGEATRTFRATADLTDVSRSVTDGQVEGCEFTESDVEADGTVTVTVHPSAWFNNVDFTQVAEGSADAPSGFEANSQPAIAFAQGLAQSSAYKFAYTQ